MTYLSSEAFRKVIKFGIVGVANTALDISIFYSLTHFLHIIPTYANIISYSICVIFSFLINSLWTFRFDLSNGVGQRFLVFSLLSVSSLILSTAIVTALSSIFIPVVSKIISVPIVFGWNFFLSHKLVFRERPQSS